MKEYDVPTITKAISIMDFIKDCDAASFADIQSSLKYAKSTTYQIIRTLQKNNLLSQTESGKYQLGFKCLAWGDAVAKNIDIRLISHDILQKLAKKVGVSVHLAIKTSDTSATFVEKIDGAVYTIHNIALGSEIVWQCSACGKVLFAWSDEQAQNNILKDINYSPYTNHSLLNKDAFLETITLVKEQGYALDKCEWTENVYGVGVPIFNYDGKLIAAISCAILASELQGKDIEQYVEYLQYSSKKITARLSE